MPFVPRPHINQTKCSVDYWENYGKAPDWSEEKATDAMLAVSTDHSNTSTQVNSWSELYLINW